ncbi:PPE domain-containing protein [Mycobacterium sp. 050128]|uniref:PPE domain-containing protein n=1 Tax=Mycobacterium sp. 050128 TaxID=3096112 RepID=UPI002ED7D6AE
MVKLPPSSRGLPAISVQQPSVPSVVKPPERPPSTLSVEPQELINRAKELAEAMPQWPDDAPKAPCELAMVRNAATVLQRSADNVSMALKTGEERWRRLAQLLVDAARKYDGVDSEAANKLTSAMPAFSATLRRPSAYQLQPDAVGSFVPPPTSPSWLGDGTRALVLQADNVFLRVRDAAKQINAGDPRATALFRFADNWGAYEGQLRDAALRFRPFESWRGAAVTQVEKQFELHRVWLSQMAANCALLSQQARALASAHCVAVVQHPRPEQVEPLHTRLTSKRISSRDYEAYKRLQKMSEDVRVEYRKQAGLPWSVINLSMPPDRADADLFKTPEEKAQEMADRSQQRAMQPMQAMLKAQKEEAEKGREEARKARQEAQEEARKAREQAQDMAQQAQEKAQEQQKAMTASFAKSMNAQQAALAKSVGGGMPKLPLPSPSKLMGAAGQLANMAKGVGPNPASSGPKPGAPLIPPLPLGGHPPHVTPAASAGAGAGIPLGGSGIGTPPRLQPPLQPPSAAQPPTGLQIPRGQMPMDPESVARPAPGPGPHGPGGAAPAGGAMGGGAAMGGLGAGQGQAGGKAKRVQPDDAAVYTEERPWTEGVIGRRPRKTEPVAPPPVPPAADGAK